MYYIYTCIYVYICIHWSTKKIMSPTLNVQTSYRSLFQEHNLWTRAMRSRLVSICTFVSVKQVMTSRQ